MELHSEAFFPLSNRYTVKMSFTHFHSNSSQGKHILHQNHAIYISLNYNWENGVKKIRLLKKICLKVVSCVSIANTKDFSIRVKMHQTFVFYF